MCFQQLNNQQSAIRIKFHIILMEIFETAPSELKYAMMICFASISLFIFYYIIKGLLFINKKVSADIKQLQFHIASTIGVAVLKCLESPVTQIIALKLIAFLAYDNLETQVLLSLMPLPASFMATLSLTRTLSPGELLVLFLFRISLHNPCEALEALNQFEAGSKT